MHVGFCMCVQASNCTMMHSGGQRKTFVELILAFHIYVGPVD